MTPARCTSVFYHYVRDVERTPFPGIRALSVAGLAAQLDWLEARFRVIDGATFERAVAGDPGETSINEHLGDAYWAVGRRIEARFAWTAALVQADPADVARLRAKLDNGGPATAQP